MVRLVENELTQFGTWKQMAVRWCAKVPNTGSITIPPLSEPALSHGIVRSRIRRPFAFANNLPYLIPFVEFTEPYIMDGLWSVFIRVNPWP